MRGLIKILFLTAAAIILLKACTPFLGTDNPLAGKAAPEFTLPAISEGEISLSAFRGGRPMVLFFWTTWCPNCLSELKKLTRMRSHIEEQGVRVLTVNVGENPAKVRRYLSLNAIHLDTALDEGGVLVGTYHLVGVPTFFEIDAQGIVARVRHFLKLDSVGGLLGDVTQPRDVVR